MNDHQYNRELAALAVQVDQERKQRVEAVKQLQQEYVNVNISGWDLK